MLIGATQVSDELLNQVVCFLIIDFESERGHGVQIHRSGTVREDKRLAFPFGERSDLDRYRLVCRRFMNIATPWKFRRFVLRFSREGFQRLNELMNMQLAVHTRFFTYMVRPSYKGNGWKRFLRKISSESPSLNKIHTLRLNDQNALLQSNSDLKILKRAISSFSSLQQIKLLRLQDAADEDILERLRENPADEDAHLDWAPACSRAVRNLGIALLSSGGPSIRFFGPQISPEAAMTLLHTPSYAISEIANRLTCLDVNFHSMRNITVIMSDLSHVFRVFFQAARHLIKINVGFPPKHPVDFSLEAIFHHFTWESLTSLGIQGWQLESREIVEILRRHQRSLQEFRTPCVYLRKGSRWKDILVVLNNEMNELIQVDLQGIDYVDHFKTEIQNGVEMPAGPPQNAAEIEEEEELTVETAPSNTNPYHQYRYYQAAGNSPVSRNGSHTDKKGTPLSIAELRVLTAEDLGDNGVKVERDQWLLWEAWVVSRMRERSRQTFP